MVEGCSNGAVEDDVSIESAVYVLPSVVVECVGFAAPFTINVLAVTEASHAGIKSSGDFIVDEELSSVSLEEYGDTEPWREEPVIGSAVVSVNCMRRSTTRLTLRTVTDESTGTNVSGMDTVSEGPIGSVGVDMQ